jgi:2-deoxy-D-gluconate 3-dehydrogenase
MILDKFSLAGKVAMVTGASRGLGQGIAVGLAEAGADIVGLSRGECTNTQQQVEALGRRFLHLPCDLSQASVAELNALADEAAARMGGLNILVNAAGTSTRHPFPEYPEDEWDMVMQTNLKSAMFLSQAVVRHFERQGGGKIIHIASALSFQGGILCPAYTASKHGIAGITKAMANELAAKHINVNAIAPGYMSTDLTAPLVNDPARSVALMARIPANRWGSPEDLKGIAVYLASEASDYTHGSVIAVDGAWLAR